MTQPDQPMARRPRLCVVCTTPLIIHFFLRAHLRRLAEFAEVTLVINTASDPYTPPLDLPVTVVHLPIQRAIAWRDDGRALVRLYRFLRRGNFDLVWAVSPKGGLLGMLAAWLDRVPVRLFIFQGEVWASRQGWGRRLLKTADWVTARCATHLLAVSRGERDFLAAEGVVEKARVGVLGEGSIGGVDLERFGGCTARRADLRAHWGVPEAATVFLFLGRLNRDKGVLDLADAFRRIHALVPEAWLLVIGPDEAGVGGEMLHRLGPAAEQCRLHGFCEHPEAAMGAADVLCLPSYREGFPVTILEAAAAGVPAIGSAIYGVADAIVDGQTGVLVPAGDSTALGDALLELARDRETRLRLGQAARRRVEEAFDSQRVVAAYGDYLRMLLGGGR